MAKVVAVEITANHYNCVNLHKNLSHTLKRGIISFLDKGLNRPNISTWWIYTFKDYKFF